MLDRCQIDVRSVNVRNKMGWVPPWRNRPRPSRPPSARPVAWRRERFLLLGGRFCKVRSFSSSSALLHSPQVVVSHHTLRRTLTSRNLAPQDSTCSLAAARTSKPNTMAPSFLALCVQHSNIYIHQNTVIRYIQQNYYIYFVLTALRVACVVCM